MDITHTSRLLGVLSDSHPTHKESRSRLRQCFLSMRERIGYLVGEIGHQLPDLTVHDISHVDALWRVADQITGPGYRINPAEAFILGGSFLLHDAAHVVAAYPGRLTDVKNTIEWKDFIAQKFSAIEPPSGSDNERQGLFFVLRQLHATQAKKLPYLNWTVPGKSQSIPLIDDFDIRIHYGDLLGTIASSHHWSPRTVVNNFRSRYLNAPSFLPNEWVVDALKIAFILRTADAAHIDDLRAPWFLFALRQPNGLSENHWKFQAKIGQPTATEDGELRISSGAAFSADEREAWWLAYDTARMIDRELRSAEIHLRDEDRPLFAANRVLGVETPETFARQVPTNGWHPVAIAARIDDVPRVIETFGGARLYGEEPEIAIRELLQNALDAVRALRVFGGLGADEGQVTVEFCRRDDGALTLIVLDTGIGMSRNVLVDVLLDFGRSLWSSDNLRYEWPGLASRGFNPAGQFGIGFFSVFMLGTQVTVSTRRHSRHSEDLVEQWTLAFESGAQGRPVLRPSTAEEHLSRSGTRVSVNIRKELCDKIFDRLNAKKSAFRDDYPLRYLALNADLPSSVKRAMFAAYSDQTLKSVKTDATNVDACEVLRQWSSLVSWMCPASEVKIVVKSSTAEIVAVNANDWKTISDEELLQRLFVESSSPLEPVRDAAGSLVGRVGVKIGSGAAEAMLVHGGIRCGKIEQFTGLVLSDRPTDVKRSESVALPDAAAWAKWAGAIVRSARLDLDQCRIMCDLSPTLDIPIVRHLVNGVFTFTEFERRIATETQIIVMLGDIGAMAWDPAGFMMGLGALEAPSPLWMLPRSGGYVPTALKAKVSPVDHGIRLEASLKTLWGKFEVERNEEMTIALCAGQPIIRPCLVYSRVD